MEAFCTPFTSEGCGHGLCAAEGNACLCNPGYVHDYTQLLFPNCYLRDDGRKGMLAALGIFSGLTALLALWVRHGKKLMPQRLCEVAIVSGLSTTAQMIALAIEGKPGAATLVFFLICNVFGGCIAPFLLLWTIVSPSMDLMMLHRKHQVVKRRMILLVTIYTTYQLAIIGSAMGFEYAGNFQMFNVILSAHFVVIALYIVVWIIAIRDSRPDSSRSNLPSPDNQIRVHRVRLGVALYFGMGVHAHRYAIFITYTTIFPLFNLILTFFASRRSASKTGPGSGSRDGSKTNGSGMSNSSKANPRVEVVTLANSSNLAVYSGANEETTTNNAGA